MQLILFPTTPTSTKKEKKERKQTKSDHFVVILSGKPSQFFDKFSQRYLVVACLRLWSDLSVDSIRL